jgi:DNA polymerase-4
MKKYGKVSRDIFEIFYTFTPKVEVISVDEAFLDITGSFHIFGTPSETGRLIKSKIKNDIGLTASIGLAPTKMAAKIASDLSKPDGFIEVTDDNLLDFLRPLEVSKISGLGAKSKAILNDRGIKTIGELAKADLESIKNIFGKNGMSLWFLANGIDDRGVENSTEVKSISNEFTFDSDTNDRQKIEKILMHLSEKVSARLREEGFRGKTVTLKIRLEGFSTYNRSMSLVKATSFVDTTYKTAIKLFNEFNLKGKKVRLIGVKVSNLIPKDSRDTLFTGVDDEKKERLHEAGDKLREKFGSKAIYRAANL